MQMARSVKDSKLDSRNARDGLKPRARPYYTTLIPGELHIGYRIRRRKGRGAQGRWTVRRYLGKDANGVGRYQERDLGLADDHLDADGKTILDFKQAQKLANEWRRDSDGGQPQPGGPTTVASAIERYFTFVEQEGRPTRDARLRADLHILPSLGSELVDTLTAERLRRWLADMAKLPPRLRQKADATAPRYKATTQDDENKRRRKSTSNRVLTILKAALNHAFDEGHAKSNNAWGRSLKPFKAVDAARTRFLSVAEAKRLVNSSEPDLRNLIVAGLHTGARFGELARLTVADFNADAGTLAIWQSKSGKPRQIYLNDEGGAFFKQLTAGRAGSEVMLRKADGTPWQKSEYSRPMAAAVARAKISPPISLHGLRHTAASLAIMNGTPLQVVARNLGHRDTRMVEAHYGHLTDSYLKDEIKKGAPTFGFAKGGKVVALEKKSAAR
jgi:integrase